MTRALPPRTRRLGVLTGAALAVTVLAGCTSAPTMPVATPTPEATVAPSGDGILRIGALLPTKGGKASSPAAAALAGVYAAVREINTAGGVLGAPVEVVVRPEGSPGDGTAEASFAELVERGADVVIGPLDATVAAGLTQKALDAGITLISPSVDSPALAEAEPDHAFARTVASYARQAGLIARLAADQGVTTGVALVIDDGDSTGHLEPSLTTALEHAAVPFASTSLLGSGDAVPGIVAQLQSSTPDLIVIATENRGDETQALLAAIHDAGIAPEKLLLTTHNTGDYPDLPKGALVGARGLVAGPQLDADFVARLKAEDPTLRATSPAGEAYDAVVIAALAATVAGDDGGPSIASRLTLVAGSHGIPCTSYGACLDVLRTEPAIAYGGILGRLHLNAAGEPRQSLYGIVSFDEKGVATRTETVAG